MFVRLGETKLTLNIPFAAKGERVPELWGSGERFNCSAEREKRGEYRICWDIMDGNIIPPLVKPTLHNQVTARIDSMGNRGT